MTGSSDGVVNFGNGLKIVWGVMNSSYLKSESAVGGYSATISLSSYGLANPAWASVCPRYPDGFPKVAIGAIGNSYIKVISDVGYISGYYIHWIAIG